MQVRELLKLCNWFKENIEGRNIPANYNLLYKKISQNVNLRNRPVQPFENEKTKLISSLEEVNFDSLTLEQINFFKKHDIYNNISPSGIVIIEDILFKNQLDISTASTKINEINTKVTNVQSLITQTKDILNKSFDNITDDEIPNDNILMRVYFKENSSIHNITELKKYSQIWYEIGRGISMAQNKSPEDFNIIGAQKGSVILEFAVYAGLATSVSTILLSGLKVTEKVLDILKKSEELKTLKLQNKKIVKDLETEAKNIKKQGVETILDEISNNLKLVKTQDGDKIIALKKSISNLLDFTENGGVIDFVTNEENENENNEEKDNESIAFREETKKIETNIKDIRKLENKVKLLIQNTKDI